MTATITGIIAIIFYLGGAILQYFSLKNRDKSNRSKVLLLGLVALLLHSVSFNGTLVIDGQLNLGISGIASLIGWLIAMLVTFSGIRKPLQNLFIGIYPIAAGGLAFTLLLTNSNETGKAIQQWTPQLSSHILLSMFAYSVLTIAAIQAALLALQDHHLRNHRTTA